MMGAVSPQTPPPHLGGRLAQPPFATDREECLHTLKRAQDGRCVCCGLDDDLEWFDEGLGLCETLCASTGSRNHVEFIPLLRQMIDYALTQVNGV